MRMILKTTAITAFLAALAACGVTREKRTTEYAIGAEAYKLENVFQVDVQRVRAVGYKIEVSWTFTNLTNGAMHFSRDSVTMNYGGKTLAVRELFGGERDIDFVASGQQKYKLYFFHAEAKGTDVKSGEYTVTFAGLKHGGGEIGSLTVPIKVP